MQNLAERSSSAVPNAFRPPTVSLPCTSRGHSSCCLCRRPGPKLVVVPVDVRHRLFISHEVIIPAGSRCCPNHLQRNIEDVKHVEGRVKPTPSRTVRTSLVIFLMKLRGGESNRILSTLFNISKSGIRRNIKAIRSALINGTFVSENLGFQHVTREQIIHQHTRPLAQTLIGDTTRPQVILDGTYIYINKRVNIKFQRQSFSFHKGRPLVKPMVIVSTTGYFISVIGPYFAKDNDATILNHIMESNIEDIRS